MAKKYLLAYIIITIIFTLFTFEIYYRIGLSKKIKTHFSGYFLLQNQVLSNKTMAVDKIFDREVVKSECLFRANSNIDLTFIPISNNLEQKNFSVQTNNLGLLSSNNYNFEKKTNEYRIIFLGESFTGPTTSTYQWVDTIEELLNKNEDLDRKLQFKTYNLGWVGGGFSTFLKEYEICGKRLKPDLIVINYLELDFPRAETKIIKDSNSQILNAKKYLEKFPSDIPIIYAAMPDYSEVMDPTKVLVKSEKLKNEMNFDFIDMREYLPMSLEKKKRESWFNLPHDSHYSDRGGELYARSLATVITNKVFLKNYDYSKVETRYSKKILNYNNKNIRLVKHSFSELIDKKEFKKEFIDYTLNKIIKGRVYRKRPYVVDMILTKKYHPINIPYNNLNHGGFEKYFYDSSKQPALINVFCTELPVDLANSNCYTHLHTFVNF